MLIEPTVCRVDAVLSEWDGTQGYARGDNNSRYALHAEQLEAVAADTLRIGQPLTLHVRFNAQGEQEFLSFRPFSLPEPSFGKHALCFNRPRIALNILLELLIIGFPNAYWLMPYIFSPDNPESARTAGMGIMLGMFASRLFGILRPQPAWQADADGVLLSLMPEGDSLYLPWRDIRSARVRHHRFGIGRVLVLEANINGKVKTSKLHLFLLSPSDQNTLLDSVKSHCAAFQAA